MIGGIILMCAILASSSVTDVSNLNDNRQNDQDFTLGSFGIGLDMMSPEDVWT
jgi:hypothetical protein